MNGTTQQRPSRVVSVRRKGGIVSSAGLLGYVHCTSSSSTSIFAGRRPDASFTIMIILRPRLYIVVLSYI